MGDAEGDGGSLLMAALAEALAEEPQGRIAGIVLLTMAESTTSTAPRPCLRPPMSC